MNSFTPFVTKFTKRLIQVGLNSLSGTWKPRASAAFLVETYFLLQVHLVPPESNKGQNSRE